MTLDTEEVIDSFLDKLEADEDFFAYYGVDEDEALRLAKERASSYLKQAMATMRREVDLDFTLSLDENGKFTEAITDDEVDVLTEIMLLKYYERMQAKLKPKLNAFAASELKLLHSPANERTSFMEMLETTREHVREVLGWYEARNRLTGERKLVDHTIPEDTEE